MPAQEVTTCTYMMKKKREKKRKFSQKYGLHRILQIINFVYEWSKRRKIFVRKLLLMYLIWLVQPLEWNNHHDLSNRITSDKNKAPSILITGYDTYLDVFLLKSGAFFILLFWVKGRHGGIHSELCSSKQGFKSDLNVIFIQKFS